MCPFCGTRTFLPERSNRVGLMFLAIMKDDAYIYNNVITCIFWCKILGRADALNCAALRLSCIVIIASLHHISCVIVIIHLTLANSQGEVCDEEEAIYYTFGPGKAQKVTDVIKKKVLRHHKKMLHYQNKRLQKCVSQILFVLLQCHSELCFIFTAR